MRIEVSVFWDEAVQKWHWRIGRVVKEDTVLSGFGITPLLRDGHARFRGSAWRQAVGAVADLKAELERNERNSARNHKFETVI